MAKGAERLMARRSLVVPLKPEKSQVALEFSFADLVSDYLQSLPRKGLSPYTIKHEKENLQAISKLLPANLSIADITSECLETDVFDAMRNKGLKPTTINGRLKTLRRTLQFAQTRGIVHFNSANMVAKMKQPYPEVPSLSFEQLRRLLEQPDIRTFAGFRDLIHIKLMLDTGIRLRESLDLELAQIDLKGRHLRKVLGKNGRLEDLPISPVMVSELEHYLHSI